MWGPRLWLDLATTHVIYPRDLLTSLILRLLICKMGMAWAVDLYSKLLQFYIPLLRHFFGGRRQNGELLTRPPFGEIHLNLLFILNSLVTILGTAQAECFGGLLVFGGTERKLTEHRAVEFLRWLPCLQHPVSAWLTAEFNESLLMD